MRETLLRAARANDVAALQAVLPKVTEADVIAALYAAAEAGSADVIAPLVAREPGLYRSYALVIAVLHERDAVIDALLPLRARPTFTYLDRSPIVEAVRRGRVDYLERFASSRDKWNEMHLPPQGDEALEAIDDGYSALLDAIRFDRLDALRAVLPHVDVNQLTWTGRTPLELAEALGRDAIVAVLKEAGATRADPTTFNAFQCATYGLVERLRPFLDDPANRRFFRSYLTLGAQMGHVEVIHEVASRGADEKELSEALGFAAQRGRLPALRALLAYGANANATSSIGYSAVHWAAARGRVDVLRELADAKAKLDKGTKGDRTSPLQLAIERGHVDALRWLLDRGVSPNARASDGSTPLDDARRHAMSDVLVPLLEAAGARGDFAKEVAKTLKKKLKKEQRKAFVPTLGPDVADPRASR
ncbi:MAG: ankyrin repeat domain-containing protein [Polyangiales bacterium]|nr:ankyrin repeat domain-containing protein [Myxococcales bacterium]